jgi:hypothetical protein
MIGWRSRANHKRSRLNAPARNNEKRRRDDCYNTKQKTESEGRLEAQQLIHVRPWRVLQIDGVMERPGAMWEGLPTAKVTRRLQQYGPNALRETDMGYSSFQ